MREYEIAVAGGGLAGLTAGLTAARLGRRVVVLTGGPVSGGLLLNIERIDGLPGFPEGVAGYELCPNVHEQAAAAGAELVGEEVERLGPADRGWTIVTAEGELRARAVVVATGARFRTLGVPGEERLSGHGVSTCATCDGPLLAGGAAAVVGGGDSALQEALTLAACVGRVVILQRGEELDGQAIYRRRVAEREGVEVRCGTVVEEIVGDETVHAVRVRDLATDAVEELEVGGVFPFVGLRPNGEPFREHLAQDADGALLTDAELRASAVGVFAAGIVRSGAVGRAAAAAGEGAAAAIAADAYLADGSWESATPASSVAPGGSSRGT